MFIQSQGKSAGVGHNVISGDVPHDGRGRDSHLRATGCPQRQIGRAARSHSANVPLDKWGGGSKRVPLEAYL